MATTTANSTSASTAAKKAAATRKRNATKRSTTATKAAATRRQTTAAKQAAETKQEAKTSIKRAGVMAEKAVLVPVGAALIARDEVKSTIDELRKSYSTRNKTENELRRFERRGTSAIKGIERDVKKSRAKIERELRQRRIRVERDLKSMIKDIDKRTAPVTKNVELVGARVENVVASGRNAAAKVSERITALA
jgi:hypothetical protein